jgi:hypothetical protein
MMTVNRMILTAAVALLGLPAVAAAHPPPRVVVGVGPYYPRPYYYYPRPAVGFGVYLGPPVVVAPARPVVVVAAPAVQVVPAPAVQVVPAPAVQAVPSQALPIPAPPTGP